MRRVSLAMITLLVVAGLSPVPASATVVPPPCDRTVSVNDVAKFEGNPVEGHTVSRPVTFTFTVTTTGCIRPGGVMYKVVSLETDPDDHSWPSDVLWWNIGETGDKRISVYVYPDDVPEANERFTVWMCPSDQVTVSGHGQGTILNDDKVTLPPSTFWPTFHCPQVLEP